MPKKEKLFSDELEKFVCCRNRSMEFFQSFQEEDIRITNSVLYQTNLIDDTEAMELPESQMRLYAFLNRYDSIPFNTESELAEYVRNNQEPFQNICVVDYLGDYAGRNNVIKITFLDGRSTLCAATKDEVGFGLYHDVLNVPKSKIAGEPIWDIDKWDLKTIYEAFREKGIIPDGDDPYTKMIRLNRTLNGINSVSGN